MNFKPVNIENLALLSGAKNHNGRCARGVEIGGDLVAGENATEAGRDVRSNHHENIIPNFSASRNSNFSLVYIQHSSVKVSPNARGSRLERESRYSISFPIPRDAVRSEIGSNGRPQRVANRNRIVEAINRANVSHDKLVHVRQALKETGRLSGRFIGNNLGRRGCTGRDTQQILRVIRGVGLE